MTLYALFLLLFLGQTYTSDTERSDYHILLRQGRTEYAAGRFAAAEKLFADALLQLPEGHESERAAILADMGAALGKLEEFSKAEKTYSDSLSISKSLGDNDNCALMLHNIGLLYSLQGRNEDALRQLHQAQELVKDHPNADVRVAAQVLNGTGTVYYRNRNNKKAEAYFNQALEAVSSPDIRFDRAAILNNLGAVYVEEHKYRQAEDTLQRVLAIKERDLGPVNPDLTQTLKSLAVLYTQTRRFDEAEDLYHRALDILEPLSSNFPTAIAQILHGLSATYQRAGRAAEGKAALEEAARIAQRNLDKDTEMATIVEEYSKALKAEGKAKEAEELHGQAARARTLSGIVVKARSAYH
jgi:tetratricopeptide (TPR) repeat protein